MGKEVVFLFGILIIGFAFMSFVMAEGNDTNNPANFSCTDSDGGKDYYVKGLTKQLGGGCWNVTENNETATVCADPAPPVEDKCIISTLANSILLKEYFCNGTSYTFEEYTCQNGKCLNGACLNQTQTNLTCSEDNDCGSGYECEDNLCVLDDENENNETDDNDDDDSDDDETEEDGRGRDNKVCC